MEPSADNEEPVLELEDIPSLGKHNDTKCKAHAFRSLPSPSLGTSEKPDPPATTLCPAAKTSITGSVQEIENKKDAALLSNDRAASEAPRNAGKTAHGLTHVGGSSVDYSLTDLLQPLECRSRKTQNAEADESQKQPRHAIMKNQPKLDFSKAWTFKPVLKPLSSQQARGEIASKENGKLPSAAHASMVRGAGASSSRQGGITFQLKAANPPRRPYLSRDALRSLLPHLPKMPASKPKASTTTAQAGKGSRSTSSSASDSDLSICSSSTSGSSTSSADSITSSSSSNSSGSSTSSDSSSSSESSSSSDSDDSSEDSSSDSLDDKIPSPPKQLMRAAGKTFSALPAFVTAPELKQWVSENAVNQEHAGAQNIPRHGQQFSQIAQEQEHLDGDSRAEADNEALGTAALSRIPPQPNTSPQTADNHAVSKKAASQSGAVPSLATSHWMIGEAASPVVEKVCRKEQDKPGSGLPPGDKHHSAQGHGMQFSDSQQKEQQLEASTQHSNHAAVREENGCSSQEQEDYFFMQSDSFKNLEEGVQWVLEELVKMKLLYPNSISEECMSALAALRKPDQLEQVVSILDDGLTRQKLSVSGNDFLWSKMHNQPMPPYYLLAPKHARRLLFWGEFRQACTLTGRQILA
ncbi:hypothetical protein WJX75_004656 [Coccomyxa subellipsoidea]|uniref:Uncharacterized protein n=1 Tax=Coccomyxa subellipsoidea TaxID=248742 RepID=A0ABR2YWX3_9CHLO